MGSVYEEITRLETAKADIETAIEGCGVNVPDTDLISAYALYIRQIPSAVFSELNVDPVGGEDQYIKSIKQVNGLIEATTGGLVSSTSSGIVPKTGTSAASVINSQANDWVLTTTKGGEPTWRKLPSNAFKNDNTNTTYSLSGALSANTYITTLTDSASGKTTATIPAMSGASSTAAGTAGLVPAPEANKHTAFLRGDGTWAVPTNYYRPISVNGTSILENNNTTLNLVAGASISITAENSSGYTGKVTITNTGVRSTTINGNYLRVNTNGTNADLTIPYATSAGNADSANLASILKSTRYDTNDPSPNTSVGVTFQFSYLASIGWHNVLTMKSYEDNNYTAAQLITPASDPGKDSEYSGDMKWRQGRNSTWLDWKTILDSSNYSSFIGSYYIPSQSMMNSAYATIPTYNGENGWHRIATIKGSVGYGSYILYLCGNWIWASNTNAIIHIDTMHTTAQLTQVSGIVGYVTHIRLVNVSNDEYYVDVYINYSGPNTPGTVHCYFLGNGTITPRTTVEKITSAVTASAELTLADGGFSHASLALKDSNDGKNITACYSTGGFSSNPSWLAAWNGYHLTYVAPSVLSVNYANSAGSVAWGNVSGKPSFATVATSGSYNDLINKPTIPTSLPANGGTATNAKYLLTLQNDNTNFYSDTYEAYLKWESADTAAFKFNDGTYKFRADVADTANGCYYVFDYNATTTPIYIGFRNAALTSTTAVALAAYGATSSGARCIKDINAAEAKKFIGLGNVQNTAFYERYATVNGTAWAMAGTYNTPTFTIYAPTTAGTSGLVLTSTAGTPGWTNQSSLSAGYLTIHDIRGNNYAPNSTNWPLFNIRAWFNNTGTPNGDCWSGITVKGWDNTYNVWLLASTSTNHSYADYGLFFRTGNGSSWTNWKNVVTSESVNNIVVTSSLPATKVNNTIYILI